LQLKHKAPLDSDRCHGKLGLFGSPFATPAFYPPEVAVAFTFASLPEIPENLRGDLIRLVEHAESILRILEETKAQRPSASSLAFTRLIAKELSISINEAGRLLNTFQNLLSLDQETGDNEKTIMLIEDRLTPEAREKWANKKPVIKAIFALLAADHPAVAAYARASGPPKCGVQNENTEVRSPSV
jgi:hypothetical protein